MSVKRKTYIISILIALAVGGLSAWISKDAMQTFDAVNKPPLSPPSWLFPVVWSVLYVLMGISSAAVYLKASENGSIKGSGLYVYAVSLVVNFFWSIIFFNLKMYLFAVIWLALLWVLVLMTIIKFARVVKRAGYLQIPYLIWCSFALYLSIGIYLMN